MYPIERRKAILDYLDKHNSVSVEELSKALLAGEATIRRDLDRMAKEGTITRTHGGAVKLFWQNFDTPYSFRESENAAIKDRLAAAAAELVRDGESIFLDGSTTAIRLLPKIAARRGLRIITNGVRTACELANSGFAGWSTGGAFTMASGALTGEAALESVRRFNADLFVFSCRAIDIGRGPTESTEGVAEVKEAMAARAAVNVLLVDSAKFGKTALHTLDIMDRLDYLITDELPSDPDGAWRDYLAAKKVKVLLA